MYKLSNFKRKFLWTHISAKFFRHFVQFLVFRRINPKPTGCPLHRVDRVLSFVGIGTPPNPHPKASEPPPGPPFSPGARGTLAGERGGGRVLIPTRGHTLWYSLYICTFLVPCIGAYTVFLGLRPWRRQRATARYMPHRYTVIQNRFFFIFTYFIETSR